jgi:amino acid transporter
MWAVTYLGIRGIDQVRNVSGDIFGLTWSIPLIPKYVTAHIPHLVDTSNTQICHRSHSSLGRYLWYPNMSPLTFLTWSIPLIPKYVTAHIPHLLDTSNTQICHRSHSSLRRYLWYPEECERWYIWVLGVSTKWGMWAVTYLGIRGIDQVRNVSGDIFGY